MKRMMKEHTNRNVESCLTDIKKRKHQQQEILYPPHVSKAAAVNNELDTKKDPMLPCCGQLFT